MFESSLGKLAPPGPWFHGQIGYELFSWLMIYGEGELAFTDTSNEDHGAAVRTFDMFGFGGGLRFTWRFTERMGIYGQPGVGAIKADVPKNELAIHGFHDAESFAPYWIQCFVTTDLCGFGILAFGSIFELDFVFEPFFSEPPTFGRRRP